MKKTIFIIFFLYNQLCCLNLLHLTFHKGCAREIEYIAHACNINLRTLFIPDLKSYSFDPTSYGNVLYNISKERTNRIWHHLSAYFNQFDAVLISDTTPLSRIFLENDWKKPLIIWICNRFDYTDHATLDNDFPDPAYYELIKNAVDLSSVRIISYTPFENLYLQLKGIFLEAPITIRPCREIRKSHSLVSFIPEKLDKQHTFFIPEYHNDTIFLDLESICKKLKIFAYRGRYNGAEDLAKFKGIIHIPYAWSTFAFFENMDLEIPYFIPTYSFLKQLISKNRNNFFHQEAFLFLDDTYHQFSEWYNGKYPNIIYFDSWKNLQEKIYNTDFNEIKKHTKIYTEIHRSTMITTWKKIFNWAGAYNEN